MKNCLRSIFATTVVALVVASGGISSRAQTGDQQTGNPPAAQPSTPTSTPPSAPADAKTAARPDARASEAANPRAFDGLWSVVIYTARGDCDRALRYSLRIVDGRVLSTDQGYRAFGKVERDGTIKVRVTDGGNSATGVGHLAGNSGRGQWRTSNGRCTGRWRAVRGGREYRGSED